MKPTSYYALSSPYAVTHTISDAELRNILRVFGEDYLDLDDRAGCWTPCGAVKDPRMIVDKIIANPPATIVFWKNGDKTVVKCSPDDEFDIEKGVAVAFMKYMFGNTGKFNELFRDLKDGIGVVYQSEDDC